MLQRSVTNSHLVLACIFTLSQLTGAATAQCGFEELGTLGGSSSRPSAASSDGSVIVGRSANGSNQLRPFIWTESTGMTDLSANDVALQQASPAALSSDGSTVVLTGFQSVLVWTATNGAIDIGGLGGPSATVGYLFGTRCSEPL